MSEEINERYIAIARACLKAINRAAENQSERAEQIQEVYQAIDSAFDDQTRAYQEEIANLSRVLERIAEGTASRDQMIQLAQAALNHSDGQNDDSIIH